VWGEVGSGCKYIFLIMLVIFFCTCDLIISLVCSQAPFQTPLPFVHVFKHNTAYDAIGISNS
jgi:hypothetical protein